LAGQWESPGGKAAGAPDKLFGQQGYEQFSVKPRLGALFIVFGQVAELCDLLEAFEDQFDLAAEPVPFENLLQRKFLLRKSSPAALAIIMNSTVSE
jgi:hypothetical protein